MKKLKTTDLKSILLILLSGISIFADAQKLPNIQQGSVRAPANIKIDGKATEWDNKFQAYNNATNVFYILSNDDDHLYLTIQANDQSVINKIIRGGITFSLNTSGKKDDKNAAGITYPVFGADAPRVSLGNKPEIIPGDEHSVKKADSLMNANNKLLSDKSKYILTKEIKGVDTLISVYNEDGIKAAEAFDNKMVYTYELAVSLKRLGVSVEKFAYNVKLNGVNIDELMKNITVKVDPGGGGASFGSRNAPASGAPTGTTKVFTMGANGSALQLLTNPTDFWGEYTLAKK